MIRVEQIAPSGGELRRVARRMRPADIAECADMMLMAPLPALEFSVRTSYETYVGYVDGEPVCIFGLGTGSMLAGVMRPWLLGTPALDRHRIAFLRRNRAMVRGWSARWPVLENWVSAEHDASIAWLRWLGFTIHEAAPAGACAKPFHRFDMRAP